MSKPADNFQTSIHQTVVSGQITWRFLGTRWTHVWNLWEKHWRLIINLTWRLIHICLKVLVPLVSNLYIIRFVYLDWLLLSLLDRREISNSMVNRKKHLIVRGCRKYVWLSPSLQGVLLSSRHEFRQLAQSRNCLSNFRWLCHEKHSFQRRSLCAFVSFLLCSIGEFYSL